MFIKVMMVVITSIGVIFGWTGMQDVHDPNIAGQDANPAGDQDVNKDEFDAFQALKIIAALHLLHFPY